MQHAWRGESDRKFVVHRMRFYSSNIGLKNVATAHVSFMSRLGDCFGHISDPGDRGVRRRGRGAFSLHGTGLLVALSIRGTLDEITCLPKLAVTRADSMRKFARVIGLNEAVSSNVPSRADINERARLRAVWHYSAAKRVGTWVTDAGDSRR